MLTALPVICLNILSLAQAEAVSTSVALWERAPLIAIIAAMLFYQGHKTDKLVETISGLTAEIRALIELSKKGK